MDHVSSRTRSKIMSKIRCKDTQPELQVRRYLHKHGFRYRLHLSKLPGRPDLVFAGRRACVFVHGCFWHGCPKCSDGRREPLSNRDYWLPKIRRNRKRDRNNVRNLRKAGWNVLEIWECEVSDSNNLKKLERSLAVCDAAV